MEFFVFYRRSPASDPPAPWGWKLATDVSDALAFLNGSGPYGAPVGDAQIGVVPGPTAPQFYVVYRRGTNEAATGAWGWKRAPDASDVVRFLNGSDPYRHPVTTARIGAYSTGVHDEFFVFYQRSVPGAPIGNWGWKRATDADDALAFINGGGAYPAPVAGFAVSGIQRGRYVDTHVFHNKGTTIWLQSPLADERFVNGEPAPLLAVLTSDHPYDGSELAWSSGVAGSLGSGPRLTVNTLAAGTH